MSVNSIIRKFNTDEDIFYEKEGTILYFKLTLDKEEIKRKNVTFCKICVNKKSSLSGISQSVFGRIQNKYLNKNKPDFLAQYAFEYNPIETNFSDSEVYKEYLFGIPLNVVSAVLEGDPHIFTIYFLNKNKNIIEFYSYVQEENINIEHYKSDSISFENLDSQADFLESNIEFILRDYNDSLDLGPIVQVSDLFEELPGNENYRDNITLKISFKDSAYEYNNIFQSDFSIKLIEDYRAGIIFDLYEDLLLLDEVSKTITLEYSYLENIVIVEKIVPKSIILSLYTSHYKKHKAFFVRDAFFENINIVIEEAGIFDTIILDPCDTKYLADFDVDLSKFKIKKGNSSIEKLFTLINLDQDSAIFSTNSLFSYSSIFGQEKKIYFINKGNSTEDSYTFYYENTEIANDDSTSNLDSLEDELNLNDSILGSQIFSDILQNPRFNGRKIIAGLNTALIYDNKNPLEHLGFNTENNDYLEREVIEDTIIKLNVNYFNVNNEKVSAVMFDRMSNLISKDLKSLSVDLSSSIGFLSNTARMEVKSITLPKNTVSKIFSQESNIIEEKESIASFLNNIAPDKFHVITDLIDKNLFKKQSKIEKKKTYELIFGIFNNIESTKRIVENENSIVDNTSIRNINKTSERNVSLNNTISELKNISSFSKHQNIVEFKSIVSVKDKSIILSSNQKNNIIANVYLDKVLKNNLDIKDLAFNVKRLITYEFYESDWKTNAYNTSSKRYFNEKEMQLITNNLPFTILGSKLIVGSKESNLQVSDDVYTSLYSCWGGNNELYINNVIERLCITIKQKSSGETIDVLFFNNRVKQDLLSSKNYIANINLLGNILHKPSIILQYR
jgi:hypothetical protein